MRSSEERAAVAYREVFGREPEVVTSAPGRVNLIGEHTDYNGGFVLPCAIERRVAVAAARGDGGLYSADFREWSGSPGVSGRDLARTGGWADYPVGVGWALAKAGYSVGAVQAAFAGDVPRGAGLSSSAAIEGATALALNALFALRIDRRELAVLCQRAENGFVGVNSGIMDQYASLLCRAGSCLFIDCRSLEARAVPLDLEGAGLALAVCDTLVERTLGATGYNDRRAACERAAHRIGVEALRDARLDDFERLSGEELKRARHVVTENARVLEAVELLERGDFEGFGALMYASHASLRDDYEVSIPQLDTFVECARETGALGARLTGAGFGGCAIALVARDRVDALEQATRGTFEVRGFGEPSFHLFHAAAGAEVVL